MNNKMKERLKELKAEYDKGSAEFAKFKNRLSDVENTLLRIDGAISILDELIKEEEQNGSREDISKQRNKGKPA